MTTGDENKPERIEGRGFLAYIYAEAEYILDLLNTYKYLRPSSWGPYVPTKYDAKDEDCFRIGNIWVYVIMSFFACLIVSGFLSIVFWLPAARSTLFEAEYYVGIAISLLLAIVYLVFRKPLRRWFLRHSPSEGTGERRFHYTEGISLLAMMLFLFILQTLVWGLPAGVFFGYFILFIGIYTFIVMLFYLIMRLQTE